METILVVDDEDVLRRIARRVLERAGYSVLDASSGEEAAEVSAGHAGEIQLLLTDIMLPGMNGREVADAQRATRPSLKVLFMSGYADDVLRKGGLQPTDDFLPKPFTPDALLRKIRAMLDA